MPNPGTENRLHPGTQFEHAEKKEGNAGYKEEDFFHGNVIDNKTALRHLASIWYLLVERQKHNGAFIFIGGGQQHTVGHSAPQFPGLQIGDDDDLFPTSSSFV